MTIKNNIYIYIYNNKKLMEFQILKDIHYQFVGVKQWEWNVTRGG